MGNLEIQLKKFIYKQWTLKNYRQIWLSSRYDLRTDLSSKLSWSRICIECYICNFGITPQMHVSYNDIKRTLDKKLSMKRWTFAKLGLEKLNNWYLFPFLLIPLSNLSHFCLFCFNFLSHELFPSPTSFLQKFFHFPSFHPSFLFPAFFLINWFVHSFPC